MRQEAIMEFGELSRQDVTENLLFAKEMELHGQLLQIPTRGGVRDAMIYPSNREGVRPVIFEIYGGAFSQGYVANDDRLRTRMRDATDFHVIGLDYRKTPDYPYPCALEDIFDAICYFCDHADLYRIDLTRMAVWGHSAGGNLAAAVALLAKETGRFSLKAQLLDYPAVDCVTPSQIKTGGDAVEVWDVFPALYAPQELRRSKYVSPVCASLEELAGTAPAAVLICDRDVGRMESEKMVEKLLHAGVPVMARLFPGSSHGFVEHWFFREWYVERMSPDQRAELPENLEEMAEAGLAFMVDAAKFYLAK